MALGFLKYDDAERSSLFSSSWAAATAKRPKTF
jgi:hypothetical protein